MRTPAVCAACILIALGATAVGCGGNDSGPARYHVSGSVTYNGQPVPRGVIQFRPDASKGTEGPAESVEIVEGKYDTSEHGFGTVGGAHVVIIHGFDGDSRPADELPLGKPLFSEYTTSAELPAQDGAQVDFDVKK